MAGGKRTVRQAGIVQAFAERLKAIRTACGLTQRDLADKAHLTLTYISRLEAGASAPGIDTLDQLARALQVAATELLPTAAAASSVEAQREQVRRLFEAVLSRAGPDTLSMLHALLSRVAESP